MKMKSFAILAGSSLLAVSFAYTAPVMADDMLASADPIQSQSEVDMQNIGDASQTNSATPGMAPGSTSDGMNNMGNGFTNSTDSMTNNNNNNNNSANPNATPDEGSPDTATGDDDY